MQRGTVAILVFLLAAVPFASSALAQTGAPNGEWPSYGGDDGSTKYAALDQIDADNVDRPQVAWQWEDRKSTRLNSSHKPISSAFFCLKKKKTNLSLTTQS